MAGTIMYLFPSRGILVGSSMQVACGLVWVRYPCASPLGWRHGSDDSRIGGWPRQSQRDALRSVQYKGEERSDEHTFSERSEQELVLMPIV